MGGVCRVVDAPYVVYRTNVRVDCNLWGVYQEDLARGGSVIIGLLRLVLYTNINL